MASQFKRAHRTHALAQRAGESYPDLSSLHGDGVKSDDVAELFAKLCVAVPEPGRRAALLGISESLDESWRRGRSLPLLKAHRPALNRALRSLR